MRTGIPRRPTRNALPLGIGRILAIAIRAGISTAMGVVKVINATENKIIGRVLDMLDDVDPLLLETNSNIEVKWKNDTGYVTVDFTNEHDQWIYEVNVE